jgi:recombination protein RecR
MGSTLNYPPPLEILLRELRRLPGIGPKSAERMALWLLADPSQRSTPLATALQAASATVRPCAKCGFFSVEELCAVCSDPKRGGHEICVVEQATDILPIERTGLFRGRYHALGGKLSPLDHIGPENLRIRELMDRLDGEQPAEIILALSADVEGGATTSYLAGMLRERGIAVSRVAHGLPAGGGLEHADSLTLQSALSGRSRL